MVAVLKTERLAKKFRRIRAVQDVSLEVEEGDIYGFLGLNGAGKTTTLRMTLGLIRPTAGRIAFFGRDLRRDFIGIMRDVGSLVELPAYYPHLSAWKNLEILRIITGNVPRPRIEEVLGLVGLLERKDDRVGAYSQGMRQRLGIAMALLPRPRLVLLDEPTNGLDPQGINHFRNVIRKLNREEGVTFLLSSHLLHEVEITCNRVGIIKEGRLVLQDTLERILDRTINGLFVRCGDPARAAALLREQAWVSEVREDGGGGVRVSCGRDRFSEVGALLHRGGMAVSEMTPVRSTLEDLFLSQ